MYKEIKGNSESRNWISTEKSKWLEIAEMLVSGWFGEGKSCRK